MVAAGLPELLKVEDIEYVLDMLMAGYPTAKAAERLHDEIQKSINTKFRVFDNMIHTWIHEG